MENSDNERIQELTQANEQLALEIHELKRNEKAMRANVEQYRTVVDDLPVLICRFLPDGEITYVNEAYCKYFTRTSEQLVGSSFLSLIPESEHKTVMNNLSALTAESPNQSHEHKVIAPNGEIRWHRWTNCALFDDQGVATTFQSIGEDITERKRIEDALLKSEERFQLAAKGATDGLWYSDLESGKEWWSQQFRELIGYSSKELPSTFESWKSIIHSDDLQRVMEAVRRHFEENQNYDIEYRMQTKTRGYRWFRARGVAIRGKDNKPVRIAGSIQDITDNMQAETALRISDRLSAIGTMVAGVAHEINTPLTTILGLAELMAKNTTLDTPMREYADQIVFQAVRTRKIIDNLLGLSRSGRISDASILINDTIQRSLNYLRRSHRFDGVEIVEDFDHNLPETYGDANRLEQVFVNIIRNAGDAMREVTTIKRLTITTQRTDDKICILFTDTGHGVGDPSRVFDAFFTTKAIGKGAGLGLSISLGIVQEHGGDITVGTSNKNTQFQVTLPIRSKPDTARTMKI